MRDDQLDGSGPQPFLDDVGPPRTPFGDNPENTRDAVWRADAANLPIFAASCPKRANKDQQAGQKRMNVEQHVAIEGLPEDVAKERVRALIAMRKKQEQGRMEVREGLFSATAWEREIQQARASLQKKDDILVQLNHLVTALQHAQYEESSRNARLRQEFEEIYAQYQDQHDQLAAQLHETPLVTQEVNFNREQRPQKITRHPVLGPEAARRAREGEDLSASRVLHDTQPAWKAAGWSESTLPLGIVDDPAAAGGQGRSRRRPCLCRDEMTKMVDRPKLVCTANATQMLRTVYMPNEHADLLVLTMESLSMQLEDQEKMCQQKARLMSEMRQTRSLEHRKRVLVNKDAIRTLKKSVRQVKVKAVERARDITSLQKTLSKQTNEMEEERHQHIKELTMCNTLRDHVLMELERKQGTSRTQFEWYRSTMDAESRARHDQFEELRLRYAELQSLYRDRIDGLDAECGKERKKLLTLQEQRKFVIERLGRQVSTLRHDVRRLQIEARGLLRGQVAWESDDPCLTYEHLEHWFAGTKPSSVGHVKPAAASVMFAEGGGGRKGETAAAASSRKAGAAAAAEAASSQTRMRVKR